MIPLRKSPFHSSIFALGLTAIALLASLLLGPYLEPDIYLLFLVAVWLSAWYYGRTGGLTATGASAALLLFFFLRPESSAAAAPSWSVALRSVTYLAMSLLITWVTASWRESRQLLSSTLSSIADAVLATD